ncbi:hypothetical protein EK21DRAFT_32641, partial [Setomelanomma holmii]
MPSKCKRPSRKYRVKAVTRQTQEAFPLMELPAEIRNQAHEYALAFPYGIKVRWNTGMKRRNKKPVMMVNADDDHDIYPANQLQYVNQKLRKETAGLEIQFNRVLLDAQRGIKIGDAIAGIFRF